MFCIRSDVITLGSIEMYGLATVWTIMDDGTYWVILIMYGSHNMRPTGLRRLIVVNRTPKFWGVTQIALSNIWMDSRLKWISIESKNVRIRVRMRKLWSSKVGGFT